MKQNEMIPVEKEEKSLEVEFSELLTEQILFPESVYVHLPMGVEIYDVKGVLRGINYRAQHMYGIDDLRAVIGKVNLFRQSLCR